MKAFWVFLLLGFPWTAAEVVLPDRPLGQDGRWFISDFAGILQPAVRTELSRLAVELEQRTSAELAVVTVPSLEGLSIEDYAEKLFNRWGIGKKGKNNGVLLLIAPGERRLKIEVGYGLEGALPDGVCGAIIRQHITPRFKTADYGGGALAGVHAIAAVLNGEAPSPVQRSGDPIHEWGPVGMTAFLFCFIIPGFIVLAVGIRQRVGMSILWGGMFGGIPLLLAWSLGGLVLALCGTAAALALVITLLRVRLKPGVKYNWSMTGGAGRTRWQSGGSGGSFGGGGGGGGFGGGCSGGGGASGGW